MHPDRPAVPGHTETAGEPPMTAGAASSGFTAWTAYWIYWGQACLLCGRRFRPEEDPVQVVSPTDDGPPKRRCRICPS